MIRKRKEKHVKTFETNGQPVMWLIFCLSAFSQISGANIPKCCPYGQNVDLVKRQCSQTDKSDSTLELIPTSSSLSESEFSALCEDGEPQPVPIDAATPLSSSQQQDLGPGHHCIDLARQENGSLTLVAWTCLSPPRCRHSACLEKCCPQNQVFGHDNQCTDVPDEGMLWTADKVSEVEVEGAVVRRSDIVTR